jgi:colanic acid/amylovoran biosynthesis glycosyltransferase
MHSFPIWLPQTQTWMFNQVRYLPGWVEKHIFCEATENLDQFELPNIHNLLEASRWRYYWDLWLRKLGIRNHLGYLVKQAKTFNAQILHSHFGNVGWGDIGAAKHANLKHIVTFYGFDLNYLVRSDPLWCGRYQDLFKYVDRILCEGLHMARCIEALGCSKEKIQVHHLGIGLDQIVFKPRVWNHDEPLRILIASSFQEKKGIPYALEALGRIQHDFRLEITIIGDSKNELRSLIEKNKVLDMIGRFNLQEKVRMLGYQPFAVLFEEAYKHHIFLSPSITAVDGDTEGGVPVSIIEMVATGMPVVSTLHCDIPEVIHHGVTGLLVQERDVEGLVASLRWLIEHEDQWCAMSERGRKHVEAEYNGKIQGERLANIYKELVVGHKS